MVHGFNDSRRRYHNENSMNKQPIRSDADIFVDIEFDKKASITPGVSGDC